LPPREINVIKRSALYSQLDKICMELERGRAYSMEDLDQGYGYINYRIDVQGSDRETMLSLDRCADRALIFLDNELIAERETANMNVDVKLELDESNHRLDILVENQGRVNFGHKMNSQRKGIDGALLINGCETGPVCHFQLPMDSPPSIGTWDDFDSKEPGFHYFEFELSLSEEGYCDTFFNMDGWGKGVVFVNGRNIGRFWDVGPQKTLYVPGPFLNEGKNEIIVFETEGKYQRTISMIDKPIIGL